MVDKTKLEQVIEKLKKLAKTEIGCDDEDFAVDDYAGGNIDDAYSMGQSHADVIMARDLLGELGVEY